MSLRPYPITSADQKRDSLHFVIVGGGSTGVELAAEIDELVHGHLSRIYSGVEQYAGISVCDVGDRFLGPFGEKPNEYAMEKFRRRDVNVRMNRHIERFEKGKMVVKEDGEVGFGIVAVWWVDQVPRLGHPEFKELILLRWLLVIAYRYPKSPLPRIPHTGMLF